MIYGIHKMCTLLLKITFSPIFEKSVKTVKKEK